MSDRTKSLRWKHFRLVFMTLLLPLLLLVDPVLGFTAPARIAFQIVAAPTLPHSQQRSILHAPRFRFRKRSKEQFLQFFNRNNSKSTNTNNQEADLAGGNNAGAETTTITDADSSTTPYTVSLPLDTITEVSWPVAVASATASAASLDQASPMTVLAALEASSTISSHFEDPPVVALASSDRLHKAAVCTAPATEAAITTPEGGGPKYVDKRWKISAVPAKRSTSISATAINIDTSTTAIKSKYRSTESNMETIFSNQNSLPDFDYNSREIRKLFVMPPSDRNLTRLETEFRGMLEYFTNFTELDLYSIPDRRVWTILQGVMGSSHEPAVYRAFEVLFEDFLPLRIAGRMIFARLKAIIQEAQQRGQAEVDAVVKTTGLQTGHVEASRLAFLTLAVATDQENDDQAHLTMEQMVDSGLAETAVELMGYESFEQFASRMDRDQDGKITFTDLMVGLQETSEETCAAVVEPCDPAQILQEVVERFSSRADRNQTLELDVKRRQYSDRFDSMVESFQAFKEYAPTSEGRRNDVLRGCFVGAENEDVVNALRVVYIDYSALRMAGNTIFSLMSALVNQLQRKRQRR